MLLRGTLDNEWSSQLKVVTNSFNNTPIKKLGWLRPNDIKSEADSAFVDFEKKSMKLLSLKSPII